MVPPSDSLLLIFVKHPIPGQVKTRLAAGTSHEFALKAYHAMLSYTAEIVEEVAADKVVFYGNMVPEEDLWEKIGYSRFLQEGADLGIRMAKAFQWGFQQGYKKIQIIGSDNPHLTSEIIQQGFTILDSNTVSLGPAEDGGYYLLGMSTFIPSVFENKNWSTETVFQDTLTDLEEANASHGLLPRLSDVDTVADIKGTFLEKLLP